MGAIVYTQMAIAGTGQKGKAKVDPSKIINWLKAYSQKVNDKWGQWLIGVGLGTEEAIEAAIVECLELEFEQKKETLKRA